MGGTCRGHNRCRHPAPCGMFLEGFVQGNAHCLAALSPQCTICPSLMGSFYRHVCTGITPPTMQEIRRGSNPPPRPKSWQSGDVNNVSDALIREWMPEHVSWQTCKHPPNTDIYIHAYRLACMQKSLIYIDIWIHTWTNHTHTHTHITISSSFASSLKRLNSWTQFTSCQVHVRMCEHVSQPLCPIFFFFDKSLYARTRHKDKRRVLKWCLPSL